MRTRFRSPARAVVLVPALAGLLAGAASAEAPKQMGWRQFPVPHGTPEKVREQVRLRRDLFPDGGLILGPSHAIQPDTPLENILAFYNSVKEYGRYPIRED
jgi:hypothetical protein